MKEVQKFILLYEKAIEYSKLVLDNTNSRKEAINYARQNLDRQELKSFFKIGELNNEQMEILGTNISVIKFSLDSLIKNLIEHPDLNFSSYNLILPNIVSLPDCVQQDRKLNLRMFRRVDDKLYEVVIKTTKNKQENYLTSFHRCDDSKLKHKKR